MRRQSEVVVRREVDDRSMVERRVRLLFVVEDAEAAVEILLLERLELVAQVGQRIGAHPRQYRRRRFGDRRSSYAEARTGGLTPGRRAERTADCANWSDEEWAAGVVPRTVFGDIALVMFLIAQALDGVLTYIGVSTFGLRAWRVTRSSRWLMASMWRGAPGAAPPRRRPRRASGSRSSSRRRCITRAVARSRRVLRRRWPSLPGSPSSITSDSRRRSRSPCLATMTR